MARRALHHLRVADGREAGVTAQRAEGERAHEDLRADAGGIPHREEERVPTRRHLLRVLLEFSP
jgi:hypothetical protein